MNDILSNNTNMSDRQEEMIRRARVWSEPIKLMVGGRMFATTKEILTKQNGSYFDIIASGKWKRNSEGNFMQRSQLCW